MKINRRWKVWLIGIILLLVSSIFVTQVTKIYISKHEAYNIGESESFARQINGYIMLLLAQEACGSESATAEITEEQISNGIKDHLVVNGNEEGYTDEFFNNWLPLYYNDQIASLLECSELEYYMVNEKTSEVITNNEDLKELVSNNYRETSFNDYDYVVKIEQNKSYIGTVDQDSNIGTALYYFAFPDYYSNNTIPLEIELTPVTCGIIADEEEDEPVDEDDVEEEDESGLSWSESDDHTFIFAVKDTITWNEATQDISFYDQNDFYNYFLYSMIALTLFIFVVSLLILIRFPNLVGKNKKVKSIPYELKAVVTIVFLVIYPVALSQILARSLIRKKYESNIVDLVDYSFSTRYGLMILGVFIGLIVICKQAVKFVALWKSEEERRRKSLFCRLMYPPQKEGKDSIVACVKRQIINLFIIQVSILIIINILEICRCYEKLIYNGLLFAKYLLVTEVIIFIISSVLMFHAILSIIKKHNKRLQCFEEAIRRISDGDSKVILTEDLKELNPIRDQINQISEGFTKAVDEAIKSQSMKTELISNVSHDLRTPLTSIISYIDLLKKESITDEERKEYLTILDQKSERLKVLIDDLFEMSKAASKNVVLDICKLDIVALTREILIEFEDGFDKKNLKLNVSYCSETISVDLDSQKTYRIIANLVSNIVKYTMPETRVYVVIAADEGHVILEFKNISETEITHQGDELMERFVREDQSRSTEGSGLGLAIAKSLTELQHGTIDIEADGDLFKVRLMFPKVK